MDFTRQLRVLLASFLISHDLAVNIKKITKTAINPEVEELLTNHPVLDGHNDLPYVIRECLSNQLYTGEYDFKVDLSENPADWQTGGSCNKPHVSTDYPRAKKGHLGAQLWSIYVDCDTQYKDAIRQTVEQLDLVKRLTELNSDIMTYCGEASCVRKAWEDGKFASLTGMEGGHSIDSSMAIGVLF